MIERFAETRFLAVLGPAGNGKSSLVRAGLLHALELGLHPRVDRAWTVVELTPGGQPLRNLATALLEALAPKHHEINVEVLTNLLKEGPQSLGDWISYYGLSSATNFLIIVDQFEELFRFREYTPKEEAEAFVRLLLESAEFPSRAIHVVITMRSEYLGLCASFPGLAERIDRGGYRTRSMASEECRDAIEGPASVLGFEIEPGLLDRLLDDVGRFAHWDETEDIDLITLLSNAADQLPLMQHALNRLWVLAEKRSNSRPVVLSLAEYDEMGGLSGAIDAHGREALAGLGHSYIRTVENVFRALLTGKSVHAPVRRPCRMSELQKIIELGGGTAQDAISVVEAFSNQDCNFLRVPGFPRSKEDAIVDISYECLLRHWTPLKGWLEKEINEGLPTRNSPFARRSRMPKLLSGWRKRT